MAFQRLASNELFGDVLGCVAPPNGGFLGARRKIKLMISAEAARHRDLGSRFSRSAGDVLI